MVDKAIEVYKEMLQEKMKPSLITYTSILQILIKTKKIQFAIDIFDEILKNKLSPDQVMYNVIVNGCVFNGRLEDACRFLFESFKANLRLCNDVYKNVFCNLLTNRIMDPSYKIEITLRVAKELKSRGLEIDYELYSKVIKMCYKTHGKNSDYMIQKEIEEYRKSCQDYSSENKDKEYNNKGGKRFNNNNNYSSYNPNYKSSGYKTYNNFPSNTGFQRMNTGNQNK